MISCSSIDVSCRPIEAFRRFSTSSRALRNGSGPGALAPVVTRYEPLGRIHVKSN